MKKLFAFLAVILMTFNAFAQSPQKMSYQAVIRNSNNALVASSPVGMRISILQGSSTGTEVYKEIYNPNPQTNTNGLVSIEIGGGIPLNGTFSAIDWASGPYFLKTETDPTGGTNYTITGTSQLLSVPYALYAKTVGNGFSGNYNDLTNKPALWDSTYNSLKNKPDLTVYATKDMGNKNITNLAAPVNAQDAVNKAYIEEKIEFMEKRLLSQAAGGTVTDIDGNIYNTVKIGNQIWMAENLKTTKYNDGTAIQLVTDSASWSASFPYNAAYCWYDNDEATYKNVYGALYKYYVINADNENVCPTGWHVPTNNEWMLMLLAFDVNAKIDYLGSASLIAGGKLKETGTTHWLSPNIGATNESGFTALPGGHRLSDGTFIKVSKTGFWWSDGLSSFSLSYNHIGVGWSEGSLGSGCSVRCLKD
jgi:uncharacterized protein (TIGR02145 family)